MKKTLLHIIIILISINSFAQQSGWLINAEYGKGTTLVHRKKMKHLAHYNPEKIELSFQKQTTGNKDWHNTYNKPKIAYSLILINFKEERLGKTFAGNIQFIYPLLKNKKHVLNMVIGLGAGYNTNPFDRKENYQNNVLGSKITGCLHVKSYYQYNVSESIGIFGGLGLIHFSNGAFKLPNLGINVGYANVGLNFKIKNTGSNDDINNFKENEFKKMNYSFDISNGAKDVVYSGGKRHWFNVVSLKSHYNLSKINRFTGGLEFFYDRSVNEFRSNFGLENDKNRNHKSSIVLGHELRIGKVYAVINYGYYTHQAYNNVYAKSYQRYQLKYKFHNNYYSAIALKVHKGVADVIECTFGLEI